MRSIVLALLFTASLSPLSAVAARAAARHAEAPAQQRSAEYDEDAKLQRAQSYLEDGRKAEAEALLRAVLASDPDSVQANDLLGGLLAQRHGFEEAATHFESALRTNLHDEVARRGEHDAAIGLALQLRNAGKGQDALLVLERSHTFLPEDTVLLTDLAIEADALHDYPRAIAALNAVLKQKPDDPTALYALARAQLDGDNPQEAEKLFHAYLALRPNDASAHYGLGRLFQMQQRTDEAEVEFNHSLELQPVQTESYYQLGQMALDAHKADEARLMFEKTLSRLPTHGGARAGIGIIDFRAKDYVQARVSLEKAIASSPDYEPAHYYLGLTLARLGDKAASTRELAVAASLAAKQQDKSKPIGVVTEEVPQLP